MAAWLILPFSKKISQNNDTKGIWVNKCPFKNVLLAQLPNKRAKIELGNYRPKIGIVDYVKNIIKLFRFPVKKEIIKIRTSVQNKNCRIKSDFLVAFFSLLI